MDGGSSKAIVHWVAKSWTWLNDFTFTFFINVLDSFWCEYFLIWCGLYWPHTHTQKHSHTHKHTHTPQGDLIVSQFSSVTESCLTLCDPMNHSTPGLPVHHQLPESTQTHVHWVSDAIQPSHPLSSPSSSALNLSQQQVFSNESALPIRWPKYWSFSFNISSSNEHPGLISFRMD